MTMAPSRNMRGRQRAFTSNGRPNKCSAFLPEVANETTGAPRAQQALEYEMGPLGRAWDSRAGLSFRGMAPLGTNKELSRPSRIEIESLRLERENLVSWNAGWDT